MTTTITASWAPVTLRADGQALIDPIAQYEVQHYTGTAPLTGTQPSVFVSAPTTSVNIPGVANGPMGVRVRAIDIVGRTSEWTAYEFGDTSDVPPATPGTFSATFTS